MTAFISTVQYFGSKYECLVVASEHPYNIVLLHKERQESFVCGNRGHIVDNHS